MRLRAAAWAALLLCFAALAPANEPRHKSEAFSRAFGPKNVVNLARPTLSWEVWAASGSTVTGTSMQLDGSDVECTYDIDAHQLSYTPDGPLSPGQHRVDCLVTIDGNFPIKRSWKFTVSGGAYRVLPNALPHQLDLLDSINQMRREMGLPDFSNDDRLAAAALAHTEYLKANNTTGHFERSGMPRFVGVQPMDRLESYGYMKDSWECVDYGGGGMQQCLLDLFAAPYHRIPFLQPGALACGGGYDERHLTVEFEMSHQTATVVSPFNGQKGVPISWSSRERPDPLRMHQPDGPVGYPIVFNHFMPGSDKIIVRHATLKTENGDDVPVFLNTPDNDDRLNFSAFVIPQRPLKPATTYIVSVLAFTEAGDDVSRTWTFSTAAVQPLAANRKK